MLEIKDAVFPSPEQWNIVVSGCRNAFKSWERSDSKLIDYYEYEDYVFYVVVNGEKIEDSNVTNDYSWNEPEIEEESLAKNVGNSYYILGKEDKGLLKRLCNAQKGEPSHSKFLRQLPVILNIRAPLFWWKQMDKYQIGTVTNSESTMHTITKNEFSIEDFSLDNTLDENWHSYDKVDICNSYLLPVEIDGHIDSILDALNELRDEYLELKQYRDSFEKAERGEIIDRNARRIFIGRSFNKNPEFFDGVPFIELADLAQRLMDRVWYTLIELLPESYMQTRTWSANYEVLRKIVKQRTGHPLEGEWKTFIEWIRENVPMAKELIFNEWPKEEENE